MPRAFLDIDIDSENTGRAAFLRGVEFVKACDLKYGLTCNELAKLGGAERARLPEVYAADWEWSQKGPAVFVPPEDRVVFKLFAKESPLAVENFMGLCMGKGKSKESGKDKWYKGCPIHRVVQGFIAQGGDFVTGTGAGGESVFGKKFKDDPAGLKLKHDRPGLLSMCNTGKNSNTSQFFLTFAPAKQLDGKHVIFGEVESGIEVLERLNATGGPDEKPLVPVVIDDCGILDDE
jgi:cyclophilin family peptidyl-prolyl cis-trans isomerase